MTDSRPGVVLVHDAFHTPAHFHSLANELRQLGFTVEVPRLPSTTAQTDPGDGLARDTTAIENAIKVLITQGKDIVIHMHGYGGLPGSEAVAAICEAQRALGPAAKQGRITKLIYLASHTLLPGETLVSEYRQDALPRPCQFHDGNIVRYQTPRESLFNTTPAALAAPAIAGITTMILSPFGASPTYCGWKDYGIPVLYVICTQDRWVSKAAQERMVARMQLLGADVQVRRVESDHSPYLEREGEYVAMMVEECNSSGETGGDEGERKRYVECCWSGYGETSTSGLVGWELEVLRPLTVGES